MSTNLINFRLQRELKEIRSMCALFDDMASDYIECCFDQHGHGAELAEELLRELYDNASDKNLLSMIVSTLLDLFEKAGYWVQATKLRMNLKDIRNMAFEQRVKESLYRRNHPNGNSWVDEWVVMHGEIVVTI